MDAAEVERAEVERAEVERAEVERAEVEEAMAGFFHLPPAGPPEAPCPPS
ncbi:hypothetical protein [Amycolatopsis arida]|nr:hypothetical protein [Amycolatopsis arida]